jgi:hypothetical protein
MVINTFKMQLLAIPKKLCGAGAFPLKASALNADPLS